MRVFCLTFLLSISMISFRASAENGTSSALRDARELFSRRQYGPAVVLLEEASQKAPKDHELIQLLAQAYLYAASESERAKNLDLARATMEKIIDNGGEAVMLVAMARDKRKGTHVVQATPGELRISRQFVSFAPIQGEGAELGGGSGRLRECAPNEKYGRDSNTFHIVFEKSEWNLRPFHFSEEEGLIACGLLSKYFNLRTKR